MYKRAPERGTDVALRVLAVVAVVVGVNVLARVTGLADVDLPAIPLPDLPSWVGTVMAVKTWLQLGVVLVVVVLVAIGWREGRRGGWGGR